MANVKYPKNLKVYVHLIHDDQLIGIHTSEQDAIDNAIAHSKAFKNTQATYVHYEVKWIYRVDPHQ